MEVKVIGFTLIFMWLAVKYKVDTMLDVVTGLIISLSTIKSMGFVMDITATI